MFVILKKEYCKSVVKLADKLLATQAKIKKKVLLIQFLKECQIKMVIPKWLTARIQKSKLKLSNKTEQLFLKSEIIKYEGSISNLQCTYENCIVTLESNISSSHFESFKAYIDLVISRLEVKYMKKNRDTVNRLVTSKFGTLTKGSVHNLSSKKLSEQESFALSLGLNFSLPCSKIDKEDIFLGFESFYKQSNKLKPRSDSEEKTFKANLSAMAYNYCKLKPEQNNLLNIAEIKKSITNLKMEKSLIITKPDKGSGCVIMDKKDYLEKMQVIINDTSKFKPLGPVDKFDNTTKLEDNIVKFLKHLVSTKEISQDICDCVKPVGSIRPRIYGLPKLHKKAVPLRPILSMVNSPQHKLAKFLNLLLEPVLKYYSDYMIKDSFSFVETIRNIKANNTCVATFDVKSLFTNVPLKEVIDICTDKLYLITKPTLRKENFVKLLKIATCDVRFSFNNEMYTQHDGVAMGSPLGPTLANIFMGFLESKVMSKTRNKIHYFRYVDDCFVVTENERELDNFYKLLNETHDSINFTCEKENNNEISYLDVLVKRRNTKFVTTVFRKVTFTGNYLNFQLNCGFKRKINLI